MIEPSGSHYPVGFLILQRFLPEVGEPFVGKDVKLSACAVLFAVELLPSRVIYAVVDEIVDKAESAASIPEFCEIVTSVDPERDPTLRTNFRNALSRLGLTLSEDQGWAILAQVGAKHASTIVAAMAMDDLDPIIGAIEISSIFRDYLPDDDRLRLCYKNQKPPIERSRCLMPFVEFYCAPDDLYHAGLNVMAWNDRLPYAPANTLTPSEKRKAQDSLRSRYLAYAKKYLEVVLRD